MNFCKKIKQIFRGQKKFINKKDLLKYSGLNEIFFLNQIMVNLRTTYIKDQ